MKNSKRIEKAFVLASEQYGELGVDVVKVLAMLRKISISVHCWQGDDVAGFENLSGGILDDSGLKVTGSYPGRARTADELRADFDKAISMIPGSHRVNIHAIYAETNGKKVDRNQILPEHFSAWTDWAMARGLGMDFNPTFFGHPLAADGFTLSHRDKSIRQFWIEHGKACRKIGESMGRKLGTPCVTNVWIPDGYKDMPADRKSPRERLKKSLDSIFSDKLNPKLNLDAVESKLFGLGSESYVVGSNEFYLAYAVENKKLLCLDAGHFHPTETISDKVSSVLTFLDEILLHVSRGVRWDSDHVVTYTDDLKAIAEEIVRGGYTDRVHIGLDYFDATINRVAAWVIGSRNMLKALLAALLEPSQALMGFESKDDLTSRLAMMEEARTLPLGAVWDYHCLTQDVPPGLDWLEDVKKYEKDVLCKRK